MRKLVTAAALVLSLSACGSAGPVTLVEKEHEPAGFERKQTCQKWDTKRSSGPKCLKYKTGHKFEVECFELEWSDGTEECTTKSRFDSLNVGDPR